MEEEKGGSIEEARKKKEKKKLSVFLSDIISPEDHMAGAKERKEKSEKLFLKSL